MDAALMHRAARAGSAATQAVRRVRVWHVTRFCRGLASRSMLLGARSAQAGGGGGAGRGNNLINQALGNGGFGGGFGGGAVGQIK